MGKNIISTALRDLVLFSKNERKFTKYIIK